MANTQINFNPAKFVSGVAKSMSAAMSMTISSYMPFTSEMIQDASDAVFNVQSFIAENRPDRNSRNESGTLRMLTTKTLNASRTFLSDLSHGELSLARTREGMSNYLKKNVKSEFDFDFDFDFDDEDNESMPEENSFTAEDYAQGVYESTMATVGAIEISSNKLALSNAKSNNILGDRLIANNMINMSQTMQMLETVNKNVSGVNANLASLIEYNNTTMNDFIKVTTTHFAKVEQFMDMVAKRYSEEAEEDQSSRSQRNDKIYDGSKIKLGNLFKKALISADSEFAGGSGILPSLVKFGATELFGGEENLPKFLKDVYGQDLSAFVDMINPANMVVQALFPELKKLKIFDNTVKGFMTSFKRKLGRSKLEGGFWNGDSVLGQWLIRLFSEDNDVYKNIKGFENKRADWTTADSTVLQNIIPQFLTESNTHLFSIRNNVDTIVNMLETSTYTNIETQKQLMSFHQDVLRQYSRQSTSKEESDEIAYSIKVLNKSKEKLKKKSDSGIRRYRASKQYATAATAANDKNKLIFDAESGNLVNARDIIEEGTRAKKRAFGTGAKEIAEAFSNITIGDMSNAEFMDRSLIGVDEKSMTKTQHDEFLVRQEKAKEKFEKFNDEFQELLSQILYDQSSDLINPQTGDIDANGLIDRFEKLLVKYDIEKEISPYEENMLYSVITSAADARMHNISEVVQKLSTNRAYMNAQKMMNPNFRAYDLYGNADLIQSRKELGKSFSSDASLQNTDDMFKTFAYGALTDAIMSGKVKKDENDPQYMALKADAERRFEGMKSAYKKKQALNSKVAKLSNNTVNMSLGAAFDVINSYASDFLVNFRRNGSPAIKDALSEFNLMQFMVETKDRYETRKYGDEYQVMVDDDGNPIEYYIYDKKDNFGYRLKIGKDGKEIGWEEDPEFVRIRAANISNGYKEYDEDTHRFFKYLTEKEIEENRNTKKGILQRILPSVTSDDDDKEYAPEQYSPPSGISFYATGATRIDRDQIAQVHEGEMILDKSLSEDVRVGIKEMINRGGFSNLSQEEQSKLLESIRESDERFKDHEMDVIKAVNRIVDQYDINTIKDMAINPSDKSVCFIDIDESDSFTSVLVKKITEIAVNLGLMAQSTLHNTQVENEEKGRGKFSKGKGFITGTKNASGMYTGGFFSNDINKIKDEINYRRFKYFDGKEYTGYTRDENGKIVEGAGLHSYSTTGENADKTETIMQKLRASAKANAEAFADSQGWVGEQREEYIKSIDNLMQGIPGAVKGGVVGLALSGVLGSAVGLIGGFALTNKETREFIFGKPYKDPDGGHHMVGGIFGGITNKLVETADKIKNNFLDAFRDVPKNMKNAFQHFVDRLTGENNDSILGGLKKFIDQITDNEGKSFIGKILGGVTNTAKQVAQSASDIALDAVTIGSKLMFKAATLPFNAFASIIGGKDYRDDKDRESKELKTKRMRALYEELIANDKAAGINSISLLPISDAIKRHFDYKDLSNKYSEFGDKSLFGEHGKLNTNLEDIPFFQNMTKFTETFAKFISDFMPNAMRGLAGSVLGGALAITGHPVLAATLVGTSMTNAIAKQIFGTGLLSIFGNAFKRLGARAKRTFSKPINAIKNRIHFMKESLGIHDTKYYMNKAIGSGQFESANILGDLNVDSETQAKYYEALNTPANQRTPEQEVLINRINMMVSDGLSEEDRSQLNTIQGYEDKYKELIKKKGNLTDVEKQFIAGYRKNAFKIKASKTIAKDRASMFEAKYGQRNYKNILSENAKMYAENPNLLHNMTNYGNNLFNSEEDIDTFIRSWGNAYAEEGPEGERRRREARDEIERRRKDILAYVKKNGGEVNENNRAKVIEMVKKSLGKTDNAFNDVDNEKLMNFLMWGNHGEEAQKINDDFRNKITGTKNSILSILKAIGHKLGVTDNTDLGSIGHGLDNDNIVEQAQQLTSEKFQEVAIQLKDANGFISTVISDDKKTFEQLDEIREKIDGLKDDIAKSNGDDGLFSFNNNPGLTPGSFNFDDAIDSAGKHIGMNGGDIPLLTSVGSGPGDIAGSAGSGGGLGEIFGSMRDSLKGLLTVFTGNKTGSNEEKMSFLDKMKESFSSVGSLISNTVMGSGLIPLKPNGQIDIGKIVTRLIALVGGVILLGPTIGKLFEKIGPYVAPMFSGISSIISSAITNGITSLSSIIGNIGPDIIAGFGTAAESLRQGIVDALKDIRFNVSVQGIGEQNEKDNAPENLANPETKEKVKNEIKDAYTDIVKAQSGASDTDVASYMEMISSNETGFSQLCATYYSTMIQYCENHFYASDTLASGIIGNTVRFVTGSYEPVTGTLDETLYSYLTASELKFFKNARKDMHTATMENFADVIYTTSKIRVYYDNELKCYHIGKNKDDTSQSRLNDIQYAPQRSTSIHDRITVLSTHTNENFLAKQKVQGFFGNGDDHSITSESTAIGYGYTQNDPRWARQSYGSFKSGRGSTIGSGGCGPTAMANVYSNLTGKRVNPAQMARFSQSNGYNAQGGTSAGLFTSGARKLGLASSAISKSGKAIGNSIRHGNNVVIAGKNGPYTRSGHIMSVRGVDSRGNAIVDDPLKRGARRIPMNKLTKGMTHAWSIGRGPAVGYGTGTAGGQTYQTWDDMFTDGTATYNRNGGSFGYVDGYNGMKNGCVYNSFVNGYLNAALGNESFEEFVKANGWSPATLHSTKTVTQFNGGGGVQDYDKLANELSNIIGRSVGIRYADISNPETSGIDINNFTDILYSNLKAGNPILFSVNDATPGDYNTSTPLGKTAYITASYQGNIDVDNAKPTSFHYQHGVLLAGIHTDGSGNEYVVISDPGRSGANQVHKMSVGKFFDAVKETDTPPYIKRVVVFDRNTGPSARYSVTQKPEDMFKAMKAGAASSSAASETFLKTFPDGDKYDTYSAWASAHPDLAKTYGEGMRSTNTGTYAPSGTAATGLTGSGVAGGTYNTGTYTAGTSQTITTDIRESTNATTFADWISDLISKFATLGSNAIGAFLTGDVDSAFKSTRTVYNGGSYVSGGSGAGGAGLLGVPSAGTYAPIVINAAYVQSLIEDAYKTYGNDSSVNSELGKIGLSKFVITTGTYTSLTTDQRYQLILKEIAASANYKKYVTQIIPNIYTWLVALKVLDHAPDAKSFTNAAQYFSNAVNSDAADIYSKLKSSKLAFSSAIAGQLAGTSINGLAIPTSSLSGYNALPAWAKVPHGEYKLYDMSQIPDYANVHDYTSAIATIGETGTKFPPKNAEELSRMYFRIYEDNGAPSFGRRGFHFNPSNYGLSAVNNYFPGEAIFANMINSGDPEIAEPAQKWFDYITAPGNFHNFPSYPNYTEITGSNKFLSALIQAEDAMNSHLHSEYFDILRSHNPNITDPRIYVLAGDIMGVAPNGIAPKLANVRTLEEAKYALSGHASRVNGVYGMITTGQGTMYGSPWTFPPYPTASIGNGDAGCNMRDDYQLYKDDVYMGDADNPMHVIMDSSPVTSRIDKLIELVDSAVNPKDAPKAGPSEAKSNSIGQGPGTSVQVNAKGSNKGVTTVGQRDKLAQLHQKLARRTRSQINYAHY